MRPGGGWRAAPVLVTSLAPVEWLPRRREGAFADECMRTWPGTVRPGRGWSAARIMTAQIRWSGQEGLGLAKRFQSSAQLEQRTLANSFALEMRMGMPFPREQFRCCFMVKKYIVKARPS